MKELEQKHLEAIESECTPIGHYGENADHIEGMEEAAKSCAIITQRHGEIQRLEAEIKIYKQFRKFFLVKGGFDYTDEFNVSGKIKRREKQLKKLKDERPGN